jgi:hypothetical protein
MLPMDQYLRLARLLLLFTNIYKVKSSARSFSEQSILTPHVASLAKQYARHGLTGSM